MCGLKFRSKVLILSGWALFALILTLGVLSLQSQAALAKPLHTDVGGEIGADTTWTLTGSPYVLTSDVVITTGVTLTVEPGVVVMGQNNTELKVLGHLEAVGTATEPITFTSSADSGPNQWSGLVFDGGIGNLRHATVRYGGDGYNSILPDPKYDGSNIAVRNGAIHLESSQVTSEHGDSGSDYGLYVENSRLVVSDTLFSDNGNYASDYALYATGLSTTITITDSTFEDNSGDGIYASGAISVTNSTFENNGDDGIYASGAISCSDPLELDNRLR